jgi:nicotinate-nucleotide pyrophosphorylase (carboxylating)
MASLDLARLPSVQALIDLALDEDLGRGDATTDAVLGADPRPIRAALVAREELVVFGIDVVRAVLDRLDPTIALEVRIGDGGAAARGAVVADLAGSAASILMAERTALNFAQRLSGVATQARRFAAAVASTAARIVDTRKTTPGWRVLEKAAVRAGGAGNHRFDLGSGILIKDNHIVACGSIHAAVERARARAPHPFRIEVEVDTLAQLDEALAAGAEIILCDNMTVDQVREAAVRVHALGRLLEVSGGVTLESAPRYAEAGADLISVGALTHSARAVDLALDFR